MKGRRSLVVFETGHLILTTKYQSMEFTDVVKMMRKYQVLYFKYRSPDHLKKAKEYERKVDQHLREIEKQQTKMDIK